MSLKVLQVLALVLTALALVPGGAHFFVLPNKIGMSQEEYFTVQAIYRGWALFGIVLFGALAANLRLAVALRDQRWPFRLTLATFFIIVGILLIFFTWIYPANQATHNWTSAPENWRELRAQWEYAHAMNGVLSFIAFCALTLAVVWAKPAAPSDFST